MFYYIIIALMDVSFSFGYWNNANVTLIENITFSFKHL